MIDTVIFDMDGLLVDSEPLWREAMAHVFEKMGIFVDEKEYERTIGLRTSEVVEYWHKQFKWEGKSLQQVLEEILEEVSRLIVREGHLMEGAQSILENFQKKSFKMGLASSSPMQVIETVLEHFSLKNFFSTIHSGEQHKYGKPHPSVYLSSAQDLQSEAFHCLVFEDSITGLIAAKAAGMNAIAVPEEKNWDNPQYAIADKKIRSLKNFEDSILKTL